MKVWPKDQFGGATLLWVRQRPSLVVTLKETDCPLRLPLLCQFWPQFRDIGCQSVVDPLMEIEITSPAPPTLVIRTRLKNEWPLIVNLTPPFLMHGTLLCWTGTIPALYLAMCWKTGWARSKWLKGGLHHPPALLGRPSFGGQKFVAVTNMDPGRHQSLSFTHLISKQAPQLNPLLNRAVLSAAVFVP